MTPKWFRNRKALERTAHSLERIRLDGEDLLVFSTDQNVTVADAAAIKARLAAYVPNPIVVLGDGCRLSALASQRK